MENQLDLLFRNAVPAIDAGDLPSLEHLLAQHPDLVRSRLDSPGPWLREKVGNALNGFFQRPYLLWFIAEDPVRNGTLPRNIAQLAATIIQAAKRTAPDTLQEQLDYALRLVSWSWIARDSGTQIELIDTLIDAGASIDGQSLYQNRYGSHADAAIYNGNLQAAAHLLKRGAPLTLTTALCLDRWDDAHRLALAATLQDKQDAFVQAALRGNAEALRRMLTLGIDPTTTSFRNQSHATALHHAVWSANLEAVKVLVEAGADLQKPDTIYGGTPLGWAEHAAQTQSNPARTANYLEIADYLRTKTAP